MEINKSILSSLN